MRGVLALPLIFLMASCYALKVIALQQPAFETSSWISSNGQAQVLKDDTLNPEDDVRLPVKSQVKTGSVERQAIPAGALVNPIFVVGDDTFSRTWLSDNREQLQRIRALGLVTNIASKKALLELETLAGMALQPVNVDELALAFHLSHYPFIAHGRFVWQ